jgi:ankyrin repeat protein
VEESDADFLRRKEEEERADFQSAVEEWRRGGQQAAPAPAPTPAPMPTRAAAPLKDVPVTATQSGLGAALRSLSKFVRANDLLKVQDTLVKLECFDGSALSPEALLDPSGQSPLDIACQVPTVSVEVVKELLRHKFTGKPFLHVKNRWGYTPLLIAAHACKVDVVKAILRASNDPNVCKAILTAANGEGNNAFHLASRHGHGEMMKVLISFAVAIKLTGELSAQNESGETPMMIAAAGGKMAIVAQLLLHNEGEMNSLERSGNNAAMLAALGGHEDIAIHLLREGTEVNVKNQIGLSILHIACSHQNGGSNKLNGLAKLVAVSLAKGADVNAKTEDDFGGDTPLHLAAASGNQALCAFLFKRGADPLILNGDGDNVEKSARFANQMDTAEKIAKGVWAVVSK